MHNDRRAPRRLGIWLHRKLTFAVGHPPPTLPLTGLPASHLDRLGNHKRRIEADAELADKAHILTGVTGELADKGGGAGPRDRAEIFDKLLSINTNAVV